MPRSTFRSALGSLGSAFLSEVRDINQHLLPFDISLSPMVFLLSYSRACTVVTYLTRPWTRPLASRSSLRTRPLLARSEIPCVPTPQQRRLPGRGWLLIAGGRSRRRCRRRARTSGGPIEFIVNVILFKNCPIPFCYVRKSSVVLLFPCGPYLLCQRGARERDVH
jgi:hypothetical protein